MANISSDTDDCLVSETMCRNLFLSEESMAILGDRWPEPIRFLRKGLLTADTLNARHPEQHSVTYQLFSTSPGRKLLFRGWAYFFPFLTESGLNQPICDEGPSPISHLFTTSMGLGLLELYGMKIKPLLTREELNRPWLFKNQRVSVVSFLSSNAICTKVLRKYWHEYYPLFECSQLGAAAPKDYARTLEDYSAALRIIDKPSPSPEERQLYLKALFLDPSRQNMQRLMAKGIDVLYSYLFETKMTWMNIRSYEMRTFMSSIFFSAYRPFSTLEPEQFQLLKTYIQDSRLQPLTELIIYAPDFSKKQLELLRDIFARNDPLLSKKIGIVIGVMNLQQLDHYPVDKFNADEQELIQSVKRALAYIKNLSMEYVNVYVEQFNINKTIAGILSIFRTPESRIMVNHFEQRYLDRNLENACFKKYIGNMCTANPSLFFEMFRMAFMKNQPHVLSIFDALFKIKELRPTFNLPHFFPNILYQLFRPCAIKHLSEGVYSEKFHEIFVPQLTAEGLNSSLSEGEKGLSALYYLCSPVGIDLLNKHWKILDHLLTKEGLNQVVESGDDVGRTPVFQLLLNPKAYKLLDEQWLVFKTLLTPEAIRRPAIIKGRSISAEDCIRILEEGQTFYSRHQLDLDLILGQASVSQIPLEVKHSDTPLLPKTDGAERLSDPNVPSLRSTQC